MFDIGVGELIALGVIGLLVFGPENYREQQPMPRSGSNTLGVWPSRPARI